MSRPLPLVTDLGALPAGVPHRFVEVTDDLRVVVVFAPPAVPGARSG